MFVILLVDSRASVSIFVLNFSLIDKLVCTERQVNVRLTSNKVKYSPYIIINYYNILINNNYLTPTQKQKYKILSILFKCKSRFS